MDPQLEALALRLAEVAVRNTGAAVAAQVSDALARKRDKDKIVELQGIIDELQNDRAQLIQIARGFEDEMVAQRISETDIQYISETLVPKVERLMALTGQSQQVEEIQQITEVVNELLSPETIRILQLLGFNFRRAIGEPLARLMVALIASKEPPADAAVLQHRREERYLQLALDADAFARWAEFTGRA